MTNAIVESVSDSIQYCKIVVTHQVNAFHTSHTGMQANDVCGQYLVLIVG